MEGEGEGPTYVGAEKILHINLLINILVVLLLLQGYYQFYDEIEESSVVMIAR